MTVFDRNDADVLGRWALAGMGPTGRFLLERWSLREDFPVVAIGHVQPEDRHWAEKFRLPHTSRLSELLSDPQIDGLILATPLSDRPALIQAAITAGKRVLVEGSLGDTAAESVRLEHLSQSSGRSIGVFHVRRHELDFHAARAMITGGRIGALQTVRWVDCEFSVPAGKPEAATRPSWPEVLASTGPLLLDQLLQLTESVPRSVQAWSLPLTAGFQARIVYPGELSAWIDVQRASRTGLRTGWVLEGSQGAYRSGQLMTVADDGELREEDVPSVSSSADDVMSDLRRLAASPREAAASLRRSVLVTALQEAIQQSAQTQQPVELTAAV